MERQSIKRLLWVIIRTLLIGGIGSGSILYGAFVLFHNGWVLGGLIVAFAALQLMYLNYKIIMRYAD